VTLKHPADWAMDRIAVLRQRRHQPIRIARYALQETEQFGFPIERLDLTAEELAAVERVRAAAEPEKNGRRSDGLHLPRRVVWRKEQRIGVEFG
jgi:hypothetical protein